MRIETSLFAVFSAACVALPAAALQDGSAEPELEPAPEEPEPDEEPEEPEPEEPEQEPAADPFDLEEHDVEAVEYEDETLPDETPEPEEIDDGMPFAKGDIELGLGLGGYGAGDYFQLLVGGAFSYYVVNRLAPGIDIQYNMVFSDDYRYPDSFTLLPTLKFVILRNARFAPYIVAAGGYEFQWGGSKNPFEGIREADAWIAGGGAGAHIGIGDHFALTVQILALYYWYVPTKIRGYDDDVFSSDRAASDQYGKFVVIDDEGHLGCDASTADCYAFYEDEDLKDRDGELFFPLIRIGFNVYF
jgi:hypothetical protein